MVDEVMRFEIAKLELRKGDTLVVKTEQHLSMVQATTLRDRVQACIAEGIPVMVLAGGLSVEVLRPE